MQSEFAARAVNGILSAGKFLITLSSGLKRVATEITFKLSHCDKEWSG